ACVAARRSHHVGQSCLPARAHRLAGARAPHAPPLHGRGRAAVLIFVFIMCGLEALMRRAILVTVAILLGGAHASGAADLKLLSPGAMSSSLRALTPQFETSSGHKVSVTYSPALALADRVRNGEVADVVILGDGPAAALERAGKLVAGSPTVIGR